MIAFTSALKWFFVGALMCGFCAPDSLDDLNINLNIKENKQKDIGQAVRPTYKPVRPTYKPVRPIYKPVRPTYKPVRPTYKPVRPTYKPLRPTYKPVHSTYKAPNGSCFEYGHHYIGKPLNNSPNDDNNYGTTGSAFGCQLLCQNIEGCSWFNWVKATNARLDQCWLKRGKGNDRPRKRPAGDVTGPRSCMTDNFYMMEYGEFCTGSSIRITNEETCKAASTELGLDWGNSWNGPDDFPGCLHTKDRRNKVYFNTSPYSSNISDWKPHFSNYAEICTYRELTCTTPYYNIGDRRDVELLKNIENPEECSRKCRERTTCNFWMWTKNNAAQYALDCVLVSGYGYTGYDKHVILGAKSCNPIEISCPAVHINFRMRRDVEVLKHIGSSQTCAIKCGQRTTCNFWTWAHNNADQYALDCVLMSGFGYKVQDNKVTSGARSCYPNEHERGTCFQYGHHFIGKPLNNPLNNPKYPNNYGTTGSALGCQVLCQNTDGCSWFNWVKATDTHADQCWLERGRTGNRLVQKPDADVTGPRSCMTG